MDGESQVVVTSPETGDIATQTTGGVDKRKRTRTLLHQTAPTSEVDSTPKRFIVGPGEVPEDDDMLMEEHEPSPSA